MTTPSAGPEPAPPAARDRHVITYRPTDERYEWIRRAAFDRHRSMQSIMDEALDRYRQESRS